MKLISIGLAIVISLLAGCSQVRFLDSKRSIEVLKEDPQKRYAGPVFHFCPMGASAAPYLVEKLTHPDVRIRSNAVNLLGKWLITSEAIEPLKERYFKEPDMLVRKNIIDSLEILMVRPDQAKAFIREVIREEINPKLNGYARVLIEEFDQKRAGAVNTVEAMTPDARKFKMAYDEIYESSGEEGDLDLMLSLSSPEDEDALAALRIKILRRNSDDALFDYQKINGAILAHRYASCRAGPAGCIVGGE